jgi:hypothetical protein
VNRFHIWVPFYCLGRKANFGEDKTEKPEKAEKEKRRKKLKLRRHAQEPDASDEKNEKASQSALPTNSNANDNEAGKESENRVDDESLKRGKYRLHGHHHGAKIEKYMRYHAWRSNYRFFILDFVVVVLLLFSLFLD